jgi:hypothetical protein
MAHSFRSSRIAADRWGLDIYDEESYLDDELSYGCGDEESPNETATPGER